LICEPERVEAAGARRAAMLHDLAALIEYARNVQPGIAAAEAGGPDDRPDPAQVERARGGRENHVGQGLRLAAFGKWVRIDPPQQLSEARVGCRDVRGEVVCEDGAAAVESRQPSGDGDAGRREAVEAEVLSPVRAADGLMDVVERTRRELPSENRPSVVDTPISTTPPSAFENATTVSWTAARPTPLLRST
jgi:hypothetical protein